MPDIKPYRIEIQQGNYVSQEMVSRLKPGMSKDQVRFVLGTPLITDSFHADRWDYVFRRQKVNSNEVEHRKMAVFFDSGKLARIEGDVMPAARAAAGKTPEAKAPATKPQTPAAGAAAVAVKTPEAKAPATKPETRVPSAAAPLAKTPEAKAPLTKPLTPAASATAPVVKAPEPRAPLTKPQTPAASAAAPAVKAPQATALPLTKETPAAGPVAQRQPISGLMPETPAAVPSGDRQPKEKKSWWERIKETLTR